MKKLIPLLLAVCLLVTPMMGKVSADDHDLSSPVDLFQQSAATDMVFPAGSVPADSALLDGIQLPIHALVLSMIEHEEDYDIHSPVFVWNGLYYALSMYGQADDRAQLTQDALLLPSESVYDFVHALFAHLGELPPLPVELDSFVTYDAASDIYHLALGDFALTETQLGKPLKQTDGTFSVDGTLTSSDDGTLLCAFRVTLVENDTMFGFSILDVSLH